MILCWAPNKPGAFFGYLHVPALTLSWFIFAVNLGCGFLTLSAIELSNYSTKWALGVTWEFLLLLAEPNYMDIKMDGFPFGILSSSQNSELDWVLTGCKSNFIKLPRPNLHIHQNPLANLSEPTGQKTVLGLRLQTRVWSYLELSSRQYDVVVFFRGVSSLGIFPMFYLN